MRRLLLTLLLVVALASSAFAQIPPGGSGSGGSGTVTSVATTAPVAGGTITDSGTISLNIPGLTATTTPVPTDILYIVVDPSGTPLSRKVTVGNLLATPRSSVAATGSANTITSAGSSTGNPVTITATGSDSLVAVRILPKGSSNYVGINPDDAVLSVHAPSAIYNLDGETFAVASFITGTPDDEQITTSLRIDVAVNGAGEDLFIYGMDLQTHYQGSGSVAGMYGGSFQSEVAGPGDVEEAYGVWANIQVTVDALGTTKRALAFYAAAPTGDNAATNIEVPISFWSEDLAGFGSIAAYYFWADSRGVARIREDDTFDSVGQAIYALYNPQFTKYTPGATDFERIITGQWNGNVAEIGTEKGGTGTLRNLRLIGSGLQFGSTLVTPASTGTRYLCISTAGVITSSAVACAGT